MMCSFSGLTVVLLCFFTVYFHSYPTGYELLFENDEFGNFTGNLEDLMEAVSEGGDIKVVLENDPFNLENGPGFYQLMCYQSLVTKPQKDDNGVVTCRFFHGFGWHYGGGDKVQMVNAECLTTGKINWYMREYTSGWKSYTPSGALSESAMKWYVKAGGTESNMLSLFEGKTCPSGWTKFKLLKEPLFDGCDSGENCFLDVIVCEKD